MYIVGSGLLLELTQGNTSIKNWTTHMKMFTNILYLKQSNWTEELTHWEKYLLCKHEDSFDSQMQYCVSLTPLLLHWDGREGQDVSEAWRGPAILVYAKMDKKVVCLRGLAVEIVFWATEMLWHICTYTQTFKYKNKITKQLLLCKIWKRAQDWIYDLHISGMFFTNELHSQI